MAIYKLIQNTVFEPKDIERLVTAYEQAQRADDPIGFYENASLTLSIDGCFLFFACHGLAPSRRRKLGRQVRGPNPRWGIAEAVKGRLTQ